MTWSKESIGNTSTVETTPSHHGTSNGGRKALTRGESVRHRRTVSTKFGHGRARDVESVRRKYLPKKRLTVHASNKEPRESSHLSPSDLPRVGQSAVSPTVDSVRAVNGFSRASRHRRAFKGSGPRVLPHEPISQLASPDSPQENAKSFGCESEASAGDKCPVNPTQVATAAKETREEYPREPVCADEAGDCTSLSGVESAISLGQVVLFSADVHEDVGPEPVVLQDTDSEGAEDTSTRSQKDFGPEPVALVDVEAVPCDMKEATKSDITKEKRPSVLKRMLKKSTSLVKRPAARGRNRPRGTMRRKGMRRRVPQNRMIRRPRKVVVMGDMFSGKSNLISAYCRDRFTTNYIPTLLNTCMTDAKVFGESIELVVIEVVGRDDYARLRKCAYHKMDAIILCYSADNSESLRRIVDYWVPELECHAPNVPFILVATKKDIRDEVVVDEATRSVSPEEVVSTTRGREVAKTIGAHSFIECSALYRDNTRHVFETAAKVAVQKSRRKRKVRRSCQNDCIIS